MLFTVAMAGLGLLLTMFGTTGHGAAERSTGTPAPGVYGGPGTGAPPSARLGWGFTHTEYSADRGTAAAEGSADKLLAAQPLPQNQAIMGWGSDNPEPSPGRYDFSGLDSRIALIRRTGGTPVITLCCAPDWMKGGTSGTTDWSRIEAAPTPDHYADFADLAAKVAHRYPDVHDFIVWNEFKGFWNDSAQRWDYEDYTRLYNLVYRAVKAVNAQNLVGGPYLNMDSVPPGTKDNASSVSGPWGSLDQRVLDALDYWMRNKAGADFLVVDGSSTTHDGALVPDDFNATQKFHDLSRWLRQDTGLPLWWAEWYVKPDHTVWPENRLMAVQATAMMQLAEGGTDTAFYWNPESESGDCSGCLWTGTEADQRGGTPLPMLDLLRRFAAVFPPGAQLSTPAVDNANVIALGSGRTLLAVNTTDQQTTAHIDGATVNLAPYAVSWTTR
ncbi:xylan 1,4-beta-xylosidase [Streptomyces sp. RB6PN23]|uniref:Xylan 1,4-beta-xylosidase n=1 Tax=Streptomyces silvisoli TaxID=3034235 RepID=A0ABT5ZN35_9ACTN|nr:xylan 1,4-beta-xylosidase [Streptomyces silvisoli]MDF3290408.1 xylan 1,4-beta-xylosidase [Streptomyces silvisoli]